jgi:hypothetical protein
VQASFDVLAAADVPAGGTCRGRPCWRTTSGLARYLDADRTPDGVQSILLKSVASPRGRVELKAKGENLELRNPRYVLVPPLIDLWDYTQGPVVVQLRSGGECWQTTFTTPRRLTGTAFVGAEGSPSGAFPAG